MEDEGWRVKDGDGGWRMEEEDVPYCCGGTYSKYRAEKYTVHPRLI
jgi:hypothetical protein